WLQPGASSLPSSLLASIATPTVIAAGAQDRLLPSIQEARRLQRHLPDASIIRLEGSGHISLDARVNLTDILCRHPKLFAEPKKNKRKDYVRDFVKPSPQYIDRYINIVEQYLGRFTSPTFFSTTVDGKIVPGLAGVPLPSNKPVLLVGNHQLFGLDLGIIIKEMYREKNVLVRGLAHPALFREGRKGGKEGGNEGGGRGGREGGEEEVLFTDDAALFTSALSVSMGGDGWEGGGGGGGGEGRETGREGKREGGREERSATDTLSNVFESFGAVPVSPANFYALLEAGEAVLLFPGGARETYHRKGEDYRLFWPTKSEFVRLAAHFGATIIPFSAVGAADSFSMLLDSQDLLSLPGPLGARVKRMSDAVPNARGAREEKEDFIAPVLWPLPPARFYFLFGSPLETDTLPGRGRDKEAVETMYQE
ncbi:hypothetical protein VYU27_010224, partial [Nannochloropsis oceanica]